MKTINLLAIVFLLTGSICAQEVKINDNLKVEADGTLVFENSATIFDDIMVFPDATTKSGSYSPVWTRYAQNGASQGTFLWMFDKDTEQELYFTVQIPHGYKQGSPLYPHVHWTTISGTPSGTNVVWGLEYTIMKIGGNFNATTTILTTNSVISGIGTPSGTRQHLISSFGQISSGTAPYDFGISTIIVCRLFRQAADSNDTFGYSVGLLGFDFHYEKDTEGSRTEFVK